MYDHEDGARQRANAGRGFTMTSVGPAAISKVVQCTPPVRPTNIPQQRVPKNNDNNDACGSATTRDMCSDNGGNSSSGSGWVSLNSSPHGVKLNNVALPAVLVCSAGNRSDRGQVNMIRGRGQI